MIVCHSQQKHPKTNHSAVTNNHGLRSNQYSRCGDLRGDRNRKATKTSIAQHKAIAAGVKGHMVWIYVLADPRNDSRGQTNAAFC